MQDYLEQLSSTNGKDINGMHTADQATVTLNETLIQTVSAQNKNIKNLFQRVVAQYTAPPTTNNLPIFPTTACQQREKEKCQTSKKMCFHKLQNSPVIPRKGGPIGHPVFSRL